MNLTNAIESAELRFKQILEEFFISVYDEKSLPSHGIDHHRRVWNHSKELLSLLPDNKSASTSNLSSKLIIASYLHDIGMSVETGIRHGRHSRDLCIQFLDKFNFPFDKYLDVLEAIENHDRKEYTENPAANELLKVLSVADDLDAFGFTGIFRYSEIYLKRGINPAEMGFLIKENAGKRFDNFVTTFGFADEFVKKNKKRYQILDIFFEQYNKQIPYYKFGGENPSGYCGVLEVFKSMIQQKQEIKDLERELEKYSYDPVVCWYFNELASEYE